MSITSNGHQPVTPYLSIEDCQAIAERLRDLSADASNALPDSEHWLGVVARAADFYELSIYLSLFLDHQRRLRDQALGDDIT